MRAKDVVSSRSGGYIAAIHDKGFTIYGGSKISKISDFSHPMCNAVKFSSNETYACSYNGVSDRLLRNGHENMIVWNVITGERLRTFKCTNESTFEMFDWSFDEKFAAAIITNNNEDTFLCIYDADTMNITEDKEGKKRPVQVEQPRAFAWANFKNHLAFQCFSIRETVEYSQAGIVDADQKEQYQWIDQGCVIHSVKMKWEEKDKFVTFALDCSTKKREIVLQVGVINLRNQSVDVNIETLSPDEKHTVNGVFIDDLGRNVAFFVTRGVLTDNKTMIKQTNFCDYFKIKHSNKTNSLEIKKTMELISAEFKSVIWSKIEDIFIFKSNHDLAFGKFKGLPSKKRTKINIPLPVSKKGKGGKGKKGAKQPKKVVPPTPIEDTLVGIRVEFPISSDTQVEFDSTGRYITCYQPDIQKLSVYNAFGLRRIV